MKGEKRNLDAAEEFYGRAGWSFEVSAPTNVPGSVGETEYIARAHHASRDVWAEGYGLTRAEARADLLAGLDRIEPSLVMTASEPERRRTSQLAHVAEIHAIEHAPSFVGLTEDDASARADQPGLSLRVISLDRPGAWTDEFGYGRVSAFSRGKIIVEATPANSNLPGSGRWSRQL